MSTIVKCGSVTHGRALAEYAEQKTIDEHLVATEAGRNGVWGLDAAEVIKEMSLHRRQSGHDLKRGYLRLEICPSKDDHEMLKDPGNRLGTIQWFLMKLGINTQWIAWLHDRTDHDADLAHIHVLANRVDLDGNVISDSLIGLRAKAAAEQFDRVRHRRTAAELTTDRRKWLKDEARAVLKSMARYDWDTFRQLCQERGVILRENVSEATGRRNGYYIKAEGTERVYKASEIDRGLTDAHIEDTHLNLRKAYERELRENKRQQHGPTVRR